MRSLPDSVCVWIVVLWGDDVLSVTGLRHGQRFSPALPEELLGTPALPLVTHDRPSPRLWIPPKAEGWFAAPASEPCALAGIGSAALELGCRARLELGAFTVLLSCTTVGPGFSARSPLDRRWRTSVAVTAAAQVALLSALSHATPALGDTEGVPLEHPPLLDVGSPSDTRAESELEDPAPDASLEPTPSLYSVTGTRCGDLYDMGRPGAEPGNRYGVEGPRDNPDPHLSSERGPRAPGVHDNSARRNGQPEPRAGVDRDPLAITAPWGRDTSLGTDEVSARGNLWGDEIAPAEGRDTLGRMNVEGGLVKRIGIGGPSSEEQRLPPRVLHTGLALSGPLELPDVEQTIAPRFAHFIGCYETARAEDPKLAGQVDIRFVIGEDGSTDDVHASRTTLGSREVVSCLEATFRGLSFPASARGKTTVSYPLFFVPGSTAASADSPPIPLGGGINRPTEARVPCGRVRPSIADDPEPPQKSRPCPK